MAAVFHWRHIRSRRPDNGARAVPTRQSRHAFCFQRFRRRITSLIPGHLPLSGRCPAATSGNLPGDRNWPHLSLSGRIPPCLSRARWHRQAVRSDRFTPARCGPPTKWSVSREAMDIDTGCKSSVITRCRFRMPQCVS